MNQRYRTLLWILAAAVGLAFVVALLTRFLGLPAMAALIQSGQFRFEGISQAQWLANGNIYRVTSQSWRHIESGALLEVEFATFESSELAGSACREQMRWASAAPETGSFSGQEIGDQCWHWLTDRSARLLFRSASCVVSLHMAGLPPNSAATVLEDVATRILRSVR